MIGDDKNDGWIHVVIVVNLPRTMTNLQQGSQHSVPIHILLIPLNCSMIICKQIAWIWMFTMHLRKTLVAGIKWFSGIVICSGSSKGHSNGIQKERREFGLLVLTIFCNCKVVCGCITRTGSSFVRCRAIKDIISL